MPSDWDGPPVAPPGRVWARIRRLIEGPRAPIDLDQYTWQDYAPRIRSHVLEEDTAAGLLRLLVRIEPGAEIPHHCHDAGEDVLVIEGCLVLEGENAGIHRPGSVFRSRTGNEHRGRALPGAECVCHVVVYLRPDEVNV